MALQPIDNTSSPVPTGRWAALRGATAMVVAGLLVGVVGALFIKTISLADEVRLTLVAAVTEHSVPGWLAASLTGLLGAAVAAWLAHRYARQAPQASVVESKGATAEATSSPAALAVNFGGTGLAVGAGLALGPERPAIQMGSAIGSLVSKLFGLNRRDRLLLMAATGGAGVATMFNSPMGCAAYTVEAVLRRVDPRITMTTLGVGALAVALMRAIVGRDVNFVVEQIVSVHFEHLLLYLGLGCAIAVLAHLHVHLIMMLARFFRLANLPGVIRGAMIGGAVGLLAWFSPTLVGTGDSLTQGILDGGFTLSALAVFLVLRFFLGPLSLAAGTPGGYFTPVLLLGALSGALYGGLVEFWLPAADLSPTAFTLVGMAVALAAVADAPFTGVLLVMETTGAFALSLPIIIAVMGSLAVTRLLRTPSLGHGLETALARRR